MECQRKAIKQLCEVCGHTMEKSLLLNYMAYLISRNRAYTFCHNLKGIYYVRLKANPSAASCSSRNH